MTLCCVPLAEAAAAAELAELAELAGRWLVTVQQRQLLWQRSARRQGAAPEEMPTWEGAGLGAARGSG